MEDFSPETVCARVAQVRLEAVGPRGKSSFAKQLGLSPSTYDYYESTRVPPADVLVRIASATGVDIRWLLTGQTTGSADQVSANPVSADRVSADHPIVQRAAKLLAQRPKSAAPLAAFLDILSQAMAFPESPAADAAKSAAAAIPLAEADPDGRTHWIPVLGRSAAGMPQFWARGEDAQGLTTLDQLISKHAGQVPSHVQPAATVSPSNPNDVSPVQIVSLTAPDSDDVAEFVAAPGIKTRYPDAFALRIDGQSMAPDIRHGDLAILSPSEAADHGRPAVVQLEGQIGVTCKLYRRSGDRVHLIPVNEQIDPVVVDAPAVVWALRVLALVRPS